MPQGRSVDGSLAMFDPETDTAYNARGTVSAAEFHAVMDRYRTESELAVVGDDGTTSVRYDPDSQECLDVRGVRPGELRPAVIAVHGGYWRMLSRHDTGFMVRVLANHGIATVPIDYSLAPQASLTEIVRQVRAGVAWLHRHGAEHGVDPERVFVLGSSAGGHLAAMTAVAGWQEALGLPPDVVKGVMPISGLFDLRPLLRTSANEWLHLDEATAVELSPALHTPSAAPARIITAAHEASGFHTQSTDFDRHWAQRAASSVQVVADRHHFDVFLELADADSPVTRNLLDLIRSTS